MLKLVLVAEGVLVHLILILKVIQAIRIVKLSTICQCNCLKLNSKVPLAEN